MPGTLNVSPGWWIDGSPRHVRDLQALGWWAHLDIKARSVTFTRIAAALS
jgi:hypothetical protein